MKFSIVNLGCKVNRVESDSLALSYLNAGYDQTDVACADIVIVNTCTVTGEAERKTRKAVRRVLRESPAERILVTGCAAEISPEFFAELDPRVSVVSKHDILDQHVATVQADFAPEKLARVGGSFPTRVAVKVQDGCNHACSYCIVHVARGRAWSRPLEEIEHEVAALGRAGVKEIVLTGIDLGSYRVEEHGQAIRLAGLLRRLLACLDANGCGDVRLRVSSIEPKSLDEDFIDLLASAQGRICRHLHLPLQAGSNKVLREMYRPYKREEFLSLVATLKQRVPGISLTTDIIVGFPGETDEEFQETCELCREVGFSKLHVFRYSKREGTPAAARADQIAPEVKEERAKQLIALGEQLRLEFASGLVGREERIVVEQEGWGMTESYFKVNVSQSLKPGTLVCASLTELDASGIFTL